MPTFDTMKAGYRNLWTNMIVIEGRKAALDSVATRINNNKERYQRVAAGFPGMPWYVIGMWHYRESNNDFRGVLHNGEHIIGTGRKTTLVPAGRGPFSTWEEAAIDALRIKSLQNIKDWTIERIGYESERFNGFGYMNKGINSPYVWSGSNLYSVGKYTSDGKYDPNHVDKQLGVMPIMRRIFDLGFAKEPQRQSAPMPPSPVGEQHETSGAAVDEGKPVTESKSLWAKVTEFILGGGAIGAGSIFGIDWRVAIAVIVVLALLSGFIIWQRLKRPDIKRGPILTWLLGPPEGGPSQES